MHYSHQSRGFYAPEVHGAEIPVDAIELSAEEYESLKLGQEHGLMISNGADGRPVLIETPINYAEAISARRYQAEVTGTTHRGTYLSTDRESQPLITSAALAAMLDPAYCCQWKTDSGFIAMDAQQLIGAASAVRAHVQACFDREAELLAHLDAGTFTAPMLDEGWPA